MNDLLATLQERVFNKEEIDSIFPYDLRGYHPRVLDQILFIYEKFGADPVRRKICAAKRKELIT